MDFPDYQFQTDTLRRLAARYGLRRYAIGESLCGRAINAADAGSGSQRVLLVGGVHGNEYLTVLAALRFLEEYAQKPSGVQLTVVPCLNPDGTQIALCTDKNWKANARGVDLNHNFDADWQQVKAKEIALGITKPSATRYGGVCPVSEPETRALVRLCEATRFERVLALHSQGREIYWDFGADTPPCCLQMAEQMAAVSGYQVAAPEDIATGGGFKDWFIRRFSRCGFTVEMGWGKNPLPLTDFEAEYPRVRQLLAVFTGSSCMKKEE